MRSAMRFTIVFILLCTCLWISEARVTKKDIRQKSVRELKHFIAERDGVCTGCVEKGHLVDAAMQLRNVETREEEVEGRLVPGSVALYAVDPSQNVQYPIARAKPGLPNKGTHLCIVHPNSTESCINVDAVRERLGVLD
eukprot:TRINITY_DN7722_c0_g2_i1.p1 TRINITY_DN7722_c0_g2~~TRINITY_DN7722_c0_g2_i1.p1  ORF type:complete len:160 (+),score=11.06 TRINITY_DN7722_c0_g2_i1:64-480(+)